MSHHTPQHAKPADAKKVPPLCWIRRYVHAHKKYRILFWLLATLINLFLLWKVEEHMVHFGALGFFSTWDLMVLAVEE